MRRSKQDTAETRRRIVESAGTALRTRGLAAASLSDLMAEAGLTHGGFYRHFDSRGGLLAEACAGAMATATGRMAAAAARPDGDGLAALAGYYLSPGHRDEIGAGCPLAALGSELVRAPVELRDTATDGVRALIAIVSAALKEPVQPQAAAIVSMLVGAVTLARAVNDPELSARLLDAAKAAVSRLAQPEGGR